MKKKNWTLLVLLVIGLHMLLLAAREIRIFWSDTGVYFLNRPEILKDPAKYLFSSFNGMVPTVIPSIRSEGQILIPMPLDKDLPKTDDQWKTYVSELYEGLKTRVESATKEGVSNFEIRTMENISLVGYFNPARQKSVVKFISAFADALSQLKTDLAENYSVDVIGIWGSNGACVATEVLAHGKSHPVDRGVLIDGRANFWSTIGAYHALKGHLSIINTKGDVPSLPWVIADPESSRLLKVFLPDLQVFRANPEGFDFLEHLKPLTSPEAKLYVREANHLGGYQESHWMTGSELISLATQQKKDDDSSFPLSLRKDEKSISYPSGVMIDIKATYLIDNTGALIRLKEAALEARPDRENLTWDFPDSEENKKKVRYPFTKEKQETTEKIFYHNENEKILLFCKAGDILIMRYRLDGPHLNFLDIAEGKIIERKINSLIFQINNILSGPATDREK